MQKQGAINENEGADELLFGVLDQNSLHIPIDYIGGPFHIWSQISSILHSFLINWQWPIPGLSQRNCFVLSVKCCICVFDFLFMADIEVTLFVDLLYLLTRLQW